MNRQTMSQIFEPSPEEKQFCVCSFVIGEHLSHMLRICGLIYSTIGKESTKPKMSKHK